MSNTLARTPYARLDIGAAENIDEAASAADVNVELKKIASQQLGLYVPTVLVAARSPYTVKQTDEIILCDCTAGAITLTFPAAARVDGVPITVIKTDASANAVTLTGTFNGAANPTLTLQFQSLVVRAGNGVYYTTPNLVTANKVSHSLTAGTHLSGGPYDGSASVTLLTDGTAANTAATLVLRDANSRTALDGVIFPATQNPSSDPNTMDDFERGTWTLSLGGNTTYTFRLGRYVKVANLVKAYGVIVVNVLGTGSATLLSGLPFTAASLGTAQTGSVGYFGSIAVNTIFIACYINDNATTVNFTGKAVSGATIDNAIAIFGDGAQVDFCIIYEAAA